MSGGVDVALADARHAAMRLVDLLHDSCERIEVAGSIRRRKPVVHDIEIVAITKLTERQAPGLFTENTETVDLLEERIGELLASVLPFEARKVEIHRQDGSIDVQERMGPSYKALTYAGVPVDLFITDTERWGAIFAIRTGPGDWNERLVTECKRVNRSVDKGRVLHLGKPVPTPEEADFFRELGQPWLDPWERTVERVAISWPVSS